jgi:hypothetical protein
MFASSRRAIEFLIAFVFGLVVAACMFAVRVLSAVGCAAAGLLLFLLVIEAMR